MEGQQQLGWSSNPKEGVVRFAHGAWDTSILCIKGQVRAHVVLSCDLSERTVDCMEALDSVTQIQAYGRNSNNGSRRGVHRSQQKSALSLLPAWNIGGGFHKPTD